jgi:hypothetical protein
MNDDEKKNPIILVRKIIKYLKENNIIDIKGVKNLLFFINNYI